MALTGQATGRSGEPRCDRPGPAAVGVLEELQKHSPRPSSLADEEEIFAGKEGYRETTLRSATLH